MTSSTVMATLTGWRPLISGLAALKLWPFRMSTLSLVCSPLVCSPGGSRWLKNPPAMQETPTRFLGWEDPLEEGMAIHSSILAWRIPMDRGDWWATVRGVTESDMTEHLSTHMFSFTCNSCAELSPSQPQSLIFPNFRNDITTNLPFVLYSPSLPSILDGYINQGESTSDTSLNPSSSMLMHI